MDKEVSPEDSIMAQSCAIAELLACLHNENFLSSEYFNSLKLESGLKQILISSGLGNPSTMQFMLYLLLVLPREFMDRNIDILGKGVDGIILKNSSYIDQNYFPKQTDYSRHLRNSIAHGTVDFYVKDNKCYVVFTDINPKNTKYFKMHFETAKVGTILENLILNIKQYLNNKYHREQ